MKHIFTLLALLLGITAATAAEPPAISLAGTRQFKLDPASVGETEHCYEDVLPLSIQGGPAGPVSVNAKLSGRRRNE
jgi:hypothetical protein